MPYHDIGAAGSHGALNLYKRQGLSCCTRLRMMRAVRFASQLNFRLFPETFEAIVRNRERIGIVSRERIAVELNKIVLSPVRP